MKGNDLGFMIFVGIVGLALISGISGGGTNGLISNSTRTPEQKQASIQQEIQTTQYKVDELQKQVQAEQDKKLASQYKGIISLQYINRGYNPGDEYVSLRYNGNSPTSVIVTGWTLKSTSTGATVTIPKATYLYFAGTKNTEDDIYLKQGDTLYLITGNSPNGASFKLNKCSGYLNQFQTFAPYIQQSCPAPRSLDLSGIPRSPVNDACFDHIESMQQCRIQTESLPQNWTYECTNFIYNKVNYPSCVNTFKNDKDFYQNEWRVYLKRSERVWKDRRETIVLYDNLGKVVDTLILY